MYRKEMKKRREGGRRGGMWVGEEEGKGGKKDKKMKLLFYSVCVCVQDLWFNCFKLHT